MTRTLLLLMFSSRVDTYVNVIAHACDKLEVKKVVLVHIRGGETPLCDSEAATVSARIWTAIDSLAHGAYLDYGAGDASDKPTDPPQRPIARSGAGLYRTIHDSLLDHQIVPLSSANLSVGLSSLIRSCGGRGACVLDVTAASKVASVDLFAVCMALGLRSIYTFELADRPNPQEPEKSLYHALAPTQYRYTSLVDREPVRTSLKALLRKGPLAYVAVGGLFLLATCLYVYFRAGLQSPPLEVFMLVATVIGLVTQFFSFARVPGRE